MCSNWAVVKQFFTGDLLTEDGYMVVIGGSFLLGAVVGIVYGYYISTTI